MFQLPDQTSPDIENLDDGQESESSGDGRVDDGQESENDETADIANAMHNGKPTAIFKRQYDKTQKKLEAIAAMDDLLSGMWHVVVVFKAKVVFCYPSWIPTWTCIL